MRARLNQPLRTPSLRALPPQDIDELDELARMIPASRGSNCASSVSHSPALTPGGATPAPPEVGTPPGAAARGGPPDIGRSRSDDITNGLYEQAEQARQHGHPRRQPRGRGGHARHDDDYAAGDYPWDDPNGGANGLGLTAPPELLRSQLAAAGGVHGGGGHQPQHATHTHCGGSGSFAAPGRRSADSVPHIERVESLNSEDALGMDRLVEGMHFDGGMDEFADGEVASMAGGSAGGSVHGGEEVEGGPEEAALAEALALAEAAAAATRLASMDGSGGMRMPSGSSALHGDSSGGGAYGGHHSGADDVLPPPLDAMSRGDEAGQTAEEARELASALMSATSAGCSGMRVGVGLQRGPRVAMEDRVMLQPLPQPPPGNAASSSGGSSSSGKSKRVSPSSASAAALSPAAYLAVFDGHNGAGTAHAASQRLHLHLRRRVLAASRTRITAAAAGASSQPSAPTAAPPPPFSDAGMRDSLEGAFADFDWWLRAHARPVSGVPTSAGSSRSEAADSVRDIGHACAGPRIVTPRRDVPDETSEHYDEAGAAGSARGLADVVKPFGSLADDEGGMDDGVLDCDGLAGGDAAAESAGRASISGGTTALVCVAWQGKLHLAYCGDSRAVLGSAGKPATRLTTDHTPSLPSEAERIIALGGFISRGRVHGILAVSRALGDLELQPYVSPEPDLSVVTLPPLSGADGSGTPTVLILASDGLWGLIGDDEATSIALAHTDDAQAAADALMAEVSRRGGRDNASVIVAAWG